MYRRIVTALLFCLSCNVEAKEYVFGKSNDNKVEFKASGNPGFLRITGSGGYLEGKVSGDVKGFKADLSVDLNNFTTGIDLRDQHMKNKYLETDKYPKAKLVIENLTGFKEAEEFRWLGKLTIKGNTKPVNGMATVKGNNLTAQFKLSIADYPEIGIPSWLGVTMAESVEVSVSAVAQ